MVNFVSSTTVVGPLLPDDIISQVDTTIETVDNASNVEIEYVKAGENSEYIYAFITSYV